MHNQKRYAEIPLRLISPDPDQPRKQFGNEALRELADSIKEVGVLQPIEVEQLPDNTFRIHHGERRWQASMIAGLERIPAIIAPPRSKQEQLVLAIVENAHRQNLNVIEEGQAYRQLQGLGLSQVEIAKRVSHSLPYVEERLLWTTLDEPIQALVAAGKISHNKEVARALLSIENVEARIQIAQVAADKRMSITAIVAACKTMVKKLQELDQTEEQDPANRSDAPALALAFNGNTTVIPADARLNLGRMRRIAKAVCESCVWYADNVDVAEPAWYLAVSAAEQTCNTCPSRGYMDICRGCPFVSFLRLLRVQVASND